MNARDPLPSVLRVVLITLGGAAPATAQERISAETSFEELAPGPLTMAESEQLTLTAAPGHAEIDAAHGRTGGQCLHLLGGEERTVEIAPDLDVPGVQALSFWAERWTRREPFAFRVEARSRGRWREVYDGSEAIAVGGFETFVTVPVESERVDRLRLVCTSPEKSGLLIDDLRLSAPADMRVVGVTTVQEVRPVLVGRGPQPVLRIDVEVEGARRPLAVTSLELTTAGTTALADVASVEVFATVTDPRPSTASRFGRPQEPAAELSVRGRQALVDGVNHLWVALELAEDADLDHAIDAACVRVSFDRGEAIAPEPSSPAGALRMGVGLRDAGDDDVSAYRIPGLATTKAGTLIAVYDARHEGWGDLPGNIDVGMSRSTDGGRTWEPMRIIADMGAPHDSNGVGDPSVLVDRVTGTIWVAALWSRGNRAWRGSGPGLAPEETGQLVLVKSDDDGRTWSRPRNITREVKDPAWRLLLQGPGKGITLRDGTLVFPAQFKDADDLPHSTLIHSADHGETWKIGTGAKPDTTEAQVVELSDGALMLNMRDNRGGSRSVCLTRDLGRTWTEHESSRSALPEPVCMASLIRLERKEGDLLLFSNPHVPRAPRRNMTIQVSADEGRTWPPERRLLLFEPNCAGYSCMTVIDPETIGILYEGGETSHLIFQRIALRDLTGE